MQKSHKKTKKSIFSKNILICVHLIPMCTVFCHFWTLFGYGRPTNPGTKKFAMKWTTIVQILSQFGQSVKFGQIFECKISFGILKNPLARLLAKVGPTRTSDNDWQWLSNTDNLRSNQNFVGSIVFYAKFWPRNSG